MTILARLFLCFFSLVLLGCAQGVQAPTHAGVTWKLAAPESVGIDGDQLDALAAEIEAGDYPGIHSLLVIRHGKLAYEAYFSGEDERRGRPIGVVEFDANTLHDVRSVTKSVVSALFGVAMTEHEELKLDEPIFAYFPDHSDLRSTDKNDILVKHALSMTTGFEWDESVNPYGHPDNDETSMDRASDRYRYVLQKPLAHQPGTQWEYSGGDTMLVTKTIERITGEDIEEYASRVLFEPLGITQHEWLRYEDGVAISASGLRLLPRDMARIGQLYLNGGRWGDQQIIPEDWVNASLQPHAFISNRPTGFQNYGFQWWLGTARVGGEFVPFASAVGWGGQRILLVPSMDLAIVVTAGLYRQPNQSGITFEIMLDRVLPTVE